MLIVNWLLAKKVVFWQWNLHIPMQLLPIIKKVWEFETVCQLYATDHEFSLVNPISFTNKSLLPLNWNIFESPHVKIGLLENMVESIKLSAMM